MFFETRSRLVPALSTYECVATRAEVWLGHFWTEISNGDASIGLELQRLGQAMGTVGRSIASVTLIVAWIIVVGIIEKESHVERIIVPRDSCVPRRCRLVFSMLSERPLNGLATDRSVLGLFR